MDEADVARVLDAAIQRRVNESLIDHWNATSTGSQIFLNSLIGGKPPPRLIVLCRMQAEAARRLQGMYRAGVIRRYTMPTVRLEGRGGGVTITADFDYIEGAGE